MVLDIRVGDVYSIGQQKGDWVNLEEGGNLGDLEVSVERVAQHGIAGARVRARLYRRLGDHQGGIDEDREDNEGEGGGGFRVWHRRFLKGLGSSAQCTTMSEVLK